MSYESPSVPKAIIDLVRHVFAGALDYRTRSNRSQAFFGWMLVSWVVGAIATLTGLLFGLVSTFGPDGWGPILADLAMIVFVGPLLVRRLHDFDYRGWWLLLLFAPLPLSLMVREAGVQLPGARVNAHLFFDVSNLGLLNVLFAALWLALMATPGSDGANRFGDPP